MEHSEKLDASLFVAYRSASYKNSKIPNKPQA